MKKYNYIVHYLTRCEYVFVSFLTVITLLFSSFEIVYARVDSLLNQSVERAILAENWGEVVNLLGPDDSLVSSPVARLIKAHACLALNRNNESLCLFLSVSSEEDLKTWKKWTNNFSNQNTKNAITQYFDGDAFARMEQWDSALVAFDKGLKLDSNHVLILNAKGVTWAAKGEWDQAWIYLTKATLVSDSFADAFASLGAMWIQRRTGAKGALEAFKQAFNINPDFALALNGQGCAQYALGHWEEAKVDFEEASRISECLPLTNLNLLALNKAKLDVMENETNELAKDTAGMSLNRRLEFSNLTNDIRLNRREVSSIISSQWRVDNLWKPFWHGISGMPWVGGIGHGMLEHLNNQTVINQKTLDQFYMSTGQGVDSDKIRRSFIDSGNWLLITWAGLLYYVRPVGE